MPLRAVVAVVITITAFLVLGFMANGVVSGNEQVLLGWLP